MENYQVPLPSVDHNYQAIILGAGRGVYLMLKNDSELYQWLPPIGVIDRAMQPAGAAGGPLWT